MRGTVGQFVGLALRVATLSVSNVVSVAIGLVLVPIQARLLDPAIWGATQLAARIGELASTLVLPGLGEAAMQSAVRGKHGNYERLRSMRFATATRVAAGIALIAAGYLAAGHADAALMILAWAAAFPWLVLGQNVPDAWLAALGEVRTLARMRVVQALCALTAALGALAAPASWSYVLWILAGLAASAWLGDRTARAACTNAETDDSVIELGLRISTARQFGNLVAGAEPLVLSWVLGLPGLAAWLAAMALSRYLKPVVINLIVALQPRFYADQPWPRTVLDLAPWIRGYFVLVCAASGALLVWGEPALAMLLGERWRESAALGALLTIGYLFNTVTDFYGVMITAQRDVAFERTTNVVTPVVNLTGITLLGLWGGLPGAALARVVTWITIVLIRLAFMLKHRVSET